MKVISERWAEFRERVIDPNAPDVQVSEMRIAFYAGFKAMLDANLELAMIDQLTAVRLLEQLHIEAPRFGASLFH